jgi:hypothetical protein
MQGLTGSHRDGKEEEEAHANGLCNLGLHGHLSHV